MARLRWGTQAPSDTDAARERLIDAAEASFLRYGVMKTTIEDVAAFANVSRATVYRYFAGREELILGVLLRSADQFFDRLGRRLGRAADNGEALVVGIF
jgi:AcrR family transcriptional regulator